MALTRTVTAGTDNGYDAAVALQRFFRDPDQGFRYEEQTQNPFDNPDALEAFLDNRVGFCEQYASAMAVMLRLVGLPARVAVGFTPGTLRTDSTYVVSTDDAHAWPEAWFDGAGWVRFEPTPVDDDREIVPTYTEEEDAAVGPVSPTTGASTDPGAQESAAPSGKDLDKALERGGDTPLADPSAGGGTRVSSSTVLLGLLAVLAVTPALLSLLRRRLRWRRPGALSAWAQLHDDARDVGYRWRPSDTPRSAAARLRSDRDLPEEAVQALGRLTAGIEQERYARAGSTVPQPWRADARTVRAALLAGSSIPVRLRAAVVPSSTLHWAAEGVGNGLATGLDRIDDLLSLLARRLHLRRA